MKLHVAYRLRVVLSLLGVTTLFVSMIFAQTTRRITGKRLTNNARGRTATASHNSTLIICQGVPVPAGYAIIAYLTSTACPHGAYVLKKQDPYSESVAARYAKPQQSPATQAGDTHAATSNSSGSSQTSPSAAAPGAGTNSVDPFVTASMRNVTGSRPVASTPPLSKSTASTRSSDTGSRPRRVAVSASPNDVAIVEDPPERPARAPQWAGTPP